MLVIFIVTGCVSYEAPSILAARFTYEAAEAYVKEYEAQGAIYPRVEVEEGLFFYNYSRYEIRELTVKGDPPKIPVMPTVREGDPRSDIFDDGMGTRRYLSK